MNTTNHMTAIARLAESEGVFTTAQARRLGIPRDALHDAVESGRVERVCRGAYRLVGSGSSETDELPHGGTTAAAMLDIGDFYLSPYRVYAPRRINSRNPVVRFGVRDIARADVTFEHGIPIIRPERTIPDLVTDGEDPSTVADAVRGDSGFDFGRLRGLLCDRYGRREGRKGLRRSAGRCRACRRGGAMRYETPAALEMAVCEGREGLTARHGPRHIRVLLFIGSSAGSSRTATRHSSSRAARATCDIDLLSAGSSLGDAPVGTEGACRGRSGRLRHVRVCRGRVPSRPRTSVAVDWTCGSYRRSAPKRMSPVPNLPRLPCRERPRGQALRHHRAAWRTSLLEGEGPRRHRRLTRRRVTSTGQGCKGAFGGRPR